MGVCMRIVKFTVLVGLIYFFVVSNVNVEAFWREYKEGFCVVIMYSLIGLAQWHITKNAVIWYGRILKANKEKRS